MRPRSTPVAAGDHEEGGREQRTDKADAGHGAKRYEHEEHDAHERWTSAQQVGVFFVEGCKFEFLVQSSEAEEDDCGRGTDDDKVLAADRDDTAEKESGEITPGVRLLHKRDARGEHH